MWHQADHQTWLETPAPGAFLQGLRNGLGAKSMFVGQRPQGGRCKGGPHVCSFTQIGRLFPGSAGAPVSLLFFEAPLAFIVFCNVRPR